MQHFLCVAAGMVLLVAGFQGISRAAEDATSLVGVAAVIDGDTLEIHGQRIRLHAIDAPESDQTCVRTDGSQWRCGQRAALELADKIGRGTVSCLGKDRDRYRRVVAVCHLHGEDLNRWMVSEGWAVAYRRYGLDYVDDEDAARSAGTGIWSGAFTMPWDWRRRNR